MLTHVDYKRFSTYQWGLEDGINEGMAKARTELESLLSEKDEAIKLEQQKLQQENNEFTMRLNNSLLSMPCPIKRLLICLSSVLRK